MSYTYNYSITEDFDNGVNATCLYEAIYTSEDISILVLAVQLELPTTASIIFESELSGPEYTTLSGIIDDHDGQATCDSETDEAIEGLPGIIVQQDGANICVCDFHAFNILNFLGDDFILSHATESGTTANIAFQKPDFIDLPDTPATYSGAATKHLAVNSAGDAVEFITFAAEEQAGLQVNRSTDFTLTDTYADLVFNNTHVETHPNVIEHSDVNQERVLIKQDGLYRITYDLDLEPINNQKLSTAETRIRLNGTSTVPGSHARISVFDDSSVGSSKHEFFNHLDNNVLVNLSTGDYITLQVRYDPALSDGSCGGDDDGAQLTVHRLSALQGATGPQGPPGSGAIINVYKDGVPVDGTPFEVLNYVGFDSVTSGTNGSVDVSLAHDHDTEYAQIDHTHTYEKIENFTLDSTDITNKYVTLDYTPRNSQVFVEGGLKGTEDTDYTVSGTQINWNGYDWENDLEAGDILSVLYWS